MPVTTENAFPVYGAELGDDPMLTTMSNVLVPDPTRSGFGQYKGILVPLVNGSAVPMNIIGPVPRIESLGTT